MLEIGNWIFFFFFQSVEQTEICSNTYVTWLKSLWSTNVMFLTTSKAGAETSLYALLSWNTLRGSLTDIFAFKSPEKGGDLKRWVLLRIEICCSHLISLLHGVYLFYVAGFIAYYFTEDHLLRGVFSECTSNRLIYINFFICILWLAASHIVFCAPFCSGM